MYDFGIRQAKSGYKIGYRPQEANHCPGCGKSQWLVGRMTAECAFCATALPLISGSAAGVGTHRRIAAPPLAA